MSFSRAGAKPRITSISPVRRPKQPPPPPLRILRSFRAAPPATHVTAWRPTAAWPLTASPSWHAT
eukprot:364988-Chlamydomonas_euryale.AAC.36